MVLLLDCVSDIDELAIFEDEEIVLLCKGLQTGDGFFAEIGEDIDVSFDHGNVRTESVSQIQQLFGGCHVGGNGDIGFLGLGNLEELLYERVGVLASACAVGQLRLGRHVSDGGVARGSATIV